MKTLPPLIVKDKYWREIEAEIRKILNEAIYFPLMGIFGEEIKNSVSALYDAVADGVVYYQDGAFKGTFNGKIARELSQLGATFNHTTSAWMLDLADVPPDVLIAQTNADREYDALRHQFIKTLDDVQIKSIDNLNRLKDKYSQTIDWLEGDFEKTVKSISIPFTFTADQRQIISKTWAQNLDLYIKGFADEQILSMRQKVEANTFEGRRSKDLIATIMRDYSVSQSKAKFLAGQETSLLVAKYKRTKYNGIGINTYFWSDSHDQRTRPDHHELGLRSKKGEYFYYDNPPITDKRTGARNNPGEDFGPCRCVDIPRID